MPCSELVRYYSHSGLPTVTVLDPVGAKCSRQQQTFIKKAGPRVKDRLYKECVTNVLCAPLRSTLFV